MHLSNSSNPFTYEMCHFSSFAQVLWFLQVSALISVVVAVEGSVWLRLVSWCCRVWCVDMHVTVLRDPHPP